MDFLNLVFGWPLLVRQILVGVAGVLLATQLNRGIYRLAWFPRAIGPWSDPHPEAPPRQWYDRLPILGWWFLRRESSVHGRGFWIRPMLLELLTGLGAVLLYGYEVERGAVFPMLPVPSNVLHMQYFSHFIFFALMIVATFIDFDEQTIPDAITVPGALLGLALAAALPLSRPLVTVANPVGFRVEFLHLASGARLPAEPSFPPWLMTSSGLLLGLLALLAWWVAILPWTWTTRRGWKKACQFFAASVWRRTGRLLPALAVIWMAGIGLTWWFGGARWESLFSSLVGLVAGGGLIWAVRIAGGRALGQEAMGFGDVTLMAMIGTFTGWQATLMIFFLAPVAAVFISVTQWLLTRRKDIAFGPYLCLATVVVVLKWGWLWQHYGMQIFGLGGFVPLLVAVCVLLIWALLTLLTFVRGG